MNDELFRERLRELRKTLGLKQSVLGELLGVNRSMISKYENGDRKPTIDAIVRLSRIFKVDVTYLMGLTDQILINVRDYVTYEKIMNLLKDDDLL